jgi:hypothetical protein
MLKDKAQAKHPLGLPAGISNHAKISLAVLGTVITLIIVVVLSSGGGGASTDVTGVLARGTEIQRVTAEVQQLNLQDPNTQALAATVSTTLASDQVQLEQYLANNHTKASPAQLSADINKSTDAQMQVASQNNSLDQTYITYLQQSLAKYSSDIQTAYKATGQNGKAILAGSLYSVNTLLTNPPLKV